MRLTKISLICSLLLCGSVISGCDTTINGFDRDRGLFSIYGFLDMHEEYNYIRIQDLNKPLVGDSTQHIDATVTLENLSSGELEVLEDSVVRFDDIYTHNFRTAMDLEYMTQYRLTVENSRGESVSVETTTPLLAQTDVAPVQEDCLTSITVSFEPVTDPADLRVTVGFEHNDRKYRSIRIEEYSGGGDLVQASFTPKKILDDVFQPDQGRDTVWCHELSSDEFFVEYELRGPDYDQYAGSGPFNIPGGTARIGAYYEDSFTFLIDTVNVLEE